MDMTLQEVKNKIAVENERTDWTHLLYDKGESEIEYFSDLSAELYASLKVKQERSKVIQECIDIVNRTYGYATQDLMISELSKLKDNV